MSRKPTKRELARLDALRDKDIDYSEIPEVDDAWFRTAQVVFPVGKQQVTLRLDADVLTWLKHSGKGYQSRINAILRAYYDAHRGDHPETPHAQS